ncbi:unnamed protein product [Mytilus edulis]|uniref:Uncharacterized protein n=1 Tax=Mytilus edulis TaxID=6550 RepID=A0A8S3S374_MYTED|nr:unnamed protein product [Mytilus edulis]
MTSPLPPTYMASVTKNITIKSKEMLPRGQWSTISQEMLYTSNYEETELNARLLKPYEEKIASEDSSAIIEEAAHKTFTNTTSPTVVTQVEPPVVTQVEPPVVTQVEPPVVTQVEPPVVTQVEPQASQVANIYFEQQQSLSLEKAHKDIKSMIEKLKVDLHDKEEYATLLLWDFAGDEEFYHTHQTFLSQDAIYLVVTKLNEADDKNAQGKY